MTGISNDINGKHVRNVETSTSMNDYGHIDNGTPLFAMAVFQKYRGIVFYIGEEDETLY